EFDGVLSHFWADFAFTPFQSGPHTRSFRLAFSAVVCDRSGGFRSGGQGMKVRFIVLALLALVATSAATASAQMQTGEIFGKVTDQSGGLLPGVTVTLTSPILLQPLTAVTSETGTYQFPRLGIGTYTVKFELTGFKTVVRDGIIVTVGFSAGVNAQM